MQFLISSNLHAVQGELSYVAQDYAFNFAPSDSSMRSSAISSIVIDTLQLAINQEYQVMYVWGYWPHLVWKRADVSPPGYTQTGLFVQLDDVIVPGISYALEEAEKWETFIDPSTGWICIGSSEYSSNEVAVEFASNCVAVLHDKALKAIWLRPYSCPKM